MHGACSSRARSHSLGLDLGKTAILLLPHVCGVHRPARRFPVADLPRLIDTPRHDSKRICRYHSTLARTLRQPHPPRCRNLLARTRRSGDHPYHAVPYTDAFSMAHVSIEQRNHDDSLRSNSSFATHYLHTDPSVDVNPSNYHPSFSTTLRLGRS